MASIKLYLDTRRLRKDGTAPLKIAVNHKARFLINLNTYILPDNFIDDQVIFPGNEKKQTSTNAYIQSRLAYVENAIRRLELQGELRGMTDKQLAAILDTNKPIKDEDEKTAPLFREVFDEYMKKGLKPKTISSYTETLNKIGKFYDLATLRITDITTQWLRDFDSKMVATCSINTRAIHFRYIRAIFNYAIDELEVVSLNELTLSNVSIY